jgi:hypothetical protein
VNSSNIWAGTYAAATRTCKLVEVLVYKDHMPATSEDSSTNTVKPPLVIIIVANWGRFIPSVLLLVRIYDVKKTHVYKVHAS